MEADVDDDDDLYAELDPPQVKNEQDLMDVDVNVDSGNEEDIDELADYSSSSSPPPTPSMSERRRGKRKAEPVRSLPQPCTGR